jgi:ABC-type Mn2+/Zn2+ transport system permease subunit
MTILTVEKTPNQSAVTTFAMTVAVVAVVLVAMCGGSLLAENNATPIANASESSLDRAVDKAVEGLDATPHEGDAHDDTHDHDPHNHDSHGHALHHYGPPSATASDHAEGNAIQAFFDSWRLFSNSYLVGWLIGALLSVVGVVVVARNQVFIGAAVSQASTLGIALALCVSGVFPIHHEEGSFLAHSALWICCDSFQVTMAVAFSILAALITSWADRAKHESHEAITGWVFLVAASLSVLVVAHSPHGLEEIYRIHSSSIIGATGEDAAVFAGLLLMTVVVVAATGRRLLLFMTDPSMAAAVGMNVDRWATCDSIWLGLTVGLSIRASGMLFTFGSLVLPALAAKNVCREVRSMFFVAPVLALAANTVGFVLANRYDSPPAQLNVAIMCLFLLAAWGVRRMRSD